jgi:hypothetical protein
MNHCMYDVSDPLSIGKEQLKRKCTLNLNSLVGLLSSIKYNVLFYPQLQKAINLKPFYWPHEASAFCLFVPTNTNLTIFNA